jgi:hypothetical protein
MVNKIIILLQKDGEFDISVNKIRSPFGVQTLFYVMGDPTLYGKGPHPNTAAWFTYWAINLATRKDSLCPYEQKNRNRFISVHKKPSLFFVCFQTSNFRGNIAQVIFSIKIVPEFKLCTVTLERTDVEGKIMVKYERLEAIPNTWQKQV